MSRTLRVLLVLMAVGAVTSLHHWRVAAAQPGVDFYQLWGIAKAQRSSGYRLGSPYRNPMGYQQQLERLAQSSADPRLRDAVGFRRQPDPTASPFTYHALGTLPEPYSRALMAYRGVQVAAFVVALFLLLRPLAPPAACLVLALVTAAAFDPLLLDARVANLGALQLLGLVAAVLALERTSPAGPALGAAIAVLLLVLVLLKPIVAAAAALLGLCLVLRARAQAVVVALACAVVGATVLGLLPAALFGSTAVWAHWWTDTFSSTARLSYGIAEGNYSGIVLLAWLAGGSAGQAMAAVLAALLASLAAVVALGWRAGVRGRAVAAAALDLLRDPLAAAALGVLALLALSPLVWSHYLVLAVIPALWLCRVRDAGPWPQALGAAGLVLAADPARRALELWEGLPATVALVTHAFGWVALWLGVLVVLRRRLAAQPAVAMAPFMTPS